MYDEVLCQTHVATAWRVKQIWKSIKERWSWIKQDLVENFVNNCNNCAIRQLLRKMDLIDLSYNADGEYTLIIKGLEATSTGYEILREASKEYEVGESVGISISKFIVRPILPCKIIKITENNQYLQDLGLLIHIIHLEKLIN
ncbi:hypothetical protein RhiirA4_472781 [Rhizophagus irregularis]|uniref:Uncharacterized protein n=1 Tax=Rhizophagus irregularis TaxID=588596 RepID=A0A2I1H5I3_9GLOM|nr:hypothetical protein RhiirA4_472781 [Rhizophagus irregularis]